MSELRIDGDYKVNKGYEDYSSQSVKGRDDEFKKKMNSIHVANSIAYMPPGGIGGLLNGSSGTQNTNTASYT